MLSEKDQLPWHPPPAAPSFSSAFSLQAETQYFACGACYSWLSGSSPALGKELYKVLFD